MIIDVQSKTSEYLELIEANREEVDDQLATMTILQELRKDIAADLCQQQYVHCSNLCTAFTAMLPQSEHGIAADGAPFPKVQGSLLALLWSCHYKQQCDNNRKGSHRNIFLPD